MNPHYPRIAERARHRCEYCRAPEVIFNLPFEVEHIIPSAHGGVDEESNLALACRACNLFRADRVHAVDEATQEAVRLFDPRAQRWEEHFEIEVDSGRILGTTPIGRATVAALQMNRPLQLTARRQWMRLGLFPESDRADDLRRWLRGETPLAHRSGRGGDVARSPGVAITPASE